MERLCRQNSNSMDDCDPSTCSHLPSSTSNSVMSKENCVLNMSPRPSHLLNSSIPNLEASLDKTSNFWDTDKEKTLESVTSILSDGRASKSSAELVKEIAMLEVEIVHLERYLLSLYRTAFQQHLPCMLGNQGTYILPQIEMSLSIRSDQPSQMLNLRTPNRCYDHQGRTSPTSALAGPIDLVEVVSPKSSSEMEKKRVYYRHRSLADHLGNSLIDDALICPNRLSEDISRCISSIYCKLANPTAILKGSASSTSSRCSSSTFSPRNLSGSWSPQCNDEVLEHYDFESVKQENGPYATMVEVLKISLDDESYNFAATMLQKFRSLVKSLEIVDPKKMRREEKLAFWINIHNALVMHAYLAYGTQNYMKSTSILKAAYNVGGNCINAYDIQSSILGIKPHYSSPWLQTLLYLGKKFKTGTIRHVFAVEYPEPLVHFALCSGAYSDPAVRVYTPNNVLQDLKVAKEEFIQATVYVHKETKIYLPKILCYYAKDMTLGIAALLEMVGSCLSAIQQKAIRSCMKGRPEKYVHWLEQSSSFRYLIHKEIGETRWGS